MRGAAFAIPLLSKAERALQIAGWGEGRNDIEIFKLIDTEGLTPLLMVLNDPHGVASTAGDNTQPG